MIIALAAFGVLYLLMCYTIAGIWAYAGLKETRNPNIWQEIWWRAVAFIFAPILIPLLIVVIARYGIHAGL